MAIRCEYDVISHGPGVVCGTPRRPVRTSKSDGIASLILAAVETRCALTSEDPAALSSRHVKSAFQSQWPLRWLHARLSREVTPAKQWLTPSRTIAICVDLIVYQSDMGSGSGDAITCKYMADIVLLEDKIGFWYTLFNCQCRSSLKAFTNWLGSWIVVWWLVLDNFLKKKTVNDLLEICHFFRNVYATGNFR